MVYIYTMSMYVSQTFSSSFKSFISVSRITSAPYSCKIVDFTMDRS